MAHLDHRGALMGKVAFGAMTVAAHLKLSDRTKLVLSLIAMHTDAHGVAYPGLKQLVKLNGLERRRIQESLKRLQEAKLIEIETGLGRGNLSVYTLTPQKAQFPGGIRAFSDDDEEEKVHDSRKIRAFYRAEKARILGRKRRGKRRGLPPSRWHRTLK
jgi:hypothetical protein